MYLVLQLSPELPLAERLTQRDDYAYGSGLAPFEAMAQPHDSTYAFRTFWGIMVRTTAICKWCLCLPGPGGLSALHCYGLRLLGSLTQEACDAPPSGHHCTVMLALHMLSVNRKGADICMCGSSWVWTGHFYLRTHTVTPFAPTTIRLQHCTMVSYVRTYRRYLSIKVNEQYHMVKGWCRSCHN